MVGKVYIKLRDSKLDISVKEGLMNNISSPLL